ncbi:MAG: S1 family peptidase [Bacteriovoracaceae bacterium]
MKFAFLFLLLTTQSLAFAFPKAPVDDLNFRPGVYLKNQPSHQYDFEGIVKLSNCSGALVQFEGQPDSDKALVMTNGHCVPAGPFGGFLKPGQVIVNKNDGREFKLFKDLKTLFPIKATKLVYATMTNTDVAFYELNESYNQIHSRTGVEPLTLASTHPVEGVDIQIISGYWERGYSCAVDGFVAKLKEADWLFTNSIRYTDGCDTIGGTSGSPLIEAGTKNVIGINNTSNESGQKCTMNNPCEVQENGEIYVRKGNRYGQQTFLAYSCLTKNFKIDLSIAGCKLPK